MIPKISKITKPICKKVIKSQYTKKNIQRILDEVPFAGNLFRTKKSTLYNKK